MHTVGTFLHVPVSLSPKSTGQGARFLTISGFGVVIHVPVGTEWAAVSPLPPVERLTRSDDRVPGSGVVISVV